MSGALEQQTTETLSYNVVVIDYLGGFDTFLSLLHSASLVPSIIWG